jgi:hypothetical protein
VPGAGNARRLTRAIVLGEPGARFDLTGLAGGETGAVLAGQIHGRGRAVGELAGVEVPATREAVDVPLVVVVGSRIRFFAFALGETFLSLDHGPWGFWHSPARDASPKGSFSYF